MLVGVTCGTVCQLSVSHSCCWRSCVLPSLKAVGQDACPLPSEDADLIQTGKELGVVLDWALLLVAALCITSAWMTSAQVCRSRMQNIFCLYHSLVSYRDIHILFLVLFSRLEIGQSVQQWEYFTWLCCWSPHVLEHIIIFFFFFLLAFCLVNVFFAEMDKCIFNLHW